MGASNSKPEEDKSVQLCRERKKYVKKALNGRCLLADTHIAYIQSLRSTGRALREFCELEGLIESSLGRLTAIPPEQHVRNEKYSSGLSFSSTPGTLSQSLSPFDRRFQASHMKFERHVSEKKEGKVASPFTGKGTSPNTPHKAKQNRNRRHVSVSSPAGTSPWDYFNLSHIVFGQQPPQTRSGVNKRIGAIHKNRSLNAEEERKINEPTDSFTESENEDETSFVLGRNDSDEFYDDFEGTLSEDFVRSFESTRGSDNVGAARLSSVASSSTEVSETIPKERSRSPDLSPLGTIASSVPAHVNLTKMVDMDEADIKDNLDTGTESKICPKDLSSSMIEIDQLFVRASESGQEIPRMLEAYKLHFRPKLPQKGESTISRCINAILSCKEPSHVPEDPAPVKTRYLTWQRTMSARFVSSMNAAGHNEKDDALPSSISDNYCMRSGSHASTLDRLYAWEKKLYDEVKVSQVVRNEYDRQCSLLRDQESSGEPVHRVDKTRVVIKDLYSRIRVAIKRMDSISKKIEEIRDSELQPQLEELVKGLSNMWENMNNCHKLQSDIISVALSNGTKIAINSDSHQQLTNHLEQQLILMSSSFLKWIAAQKSYLQAIDGWLLKCVIFPEKSSRKKRRQQPISIRRYGPPIFITCGEWLEGLEKVPTKDLSDSVKCLAAETSRLLPRQEKHHGNNNLDYTLRQAGSSFNASSSSNIWKSDVDNFRTSLVHFFSQLRLFSESSVNMYRELDISIQEAKMNYQQLKP